MKLMPPIPNTPDARRLTELAQASGTCTDPQDLLGVSAETLAGMRYGDRAPLVADVLRWQGAVHRDLGQLIDAEGLFFRSLRVSIDLGYSAGRAHAMNGFGTVAQRRGDLAGAREMFMEADAIARRGSDTRLIGVVRQNLGAVADVLGELTDAFEHFSVSLRSFESIRDGHGAAWVLNDIGVLHAKENRIWEAHEAFERGLGIARERGDLQCEGAIEENRAELYLKSDDLDRSPPSIERALRVAEDRRDTPRRAAALKLRGAHFRLSGNVAAAIETLRHAVTLSESGDHPGLRTEILYQFGAAIFASGDVVKANDVWQLALEGFDQTDVSGWPARLRDRLTNGGLDRYL
jgi:tetratricopeptide (TPR) repeat protein